MHYYTKYLTTRITIDNQTLTTFKLTDHDNTEYGKVLANMTASKLLPVAGMLDPKYPRTFTLTEVGVGNVANKILFAVDNNGVVINVYPYKGVNFAIIDEHVLLLPLEKWPQNLISTDAFASEAWHPVGKTIVLYSGSTYIKK